MCDALENLGNIMLCTNSIHVAIHKKEPSKSSIESLRAEKHTQPSRSKMAAVVVYSATLFFRARILDMQQSIEEKKAAVQRLQKEIDEQTKQLSKMEDQQRILLQRIRDSSLMNREATGDDSKKTTKVKGGKATKKRSPPEDDERGVSVEKTLGDS